MSSKNLEQLSTHSIGGGWGQEAPDDKHTEKVAIIRGTDIPRITHGDVSSVPFRWETPSKVKSRLLQAGDIVIEVSGGSAASGQHTGRALYITQETLNRLGGSVIPASFCRLLRLDQMQIDARYLCFEIAGMHLSGEIAEYENQSTGIANFQFTRFLSDVTPKIEVIEEQREVATVLGALDDRITLLRETNKTLEAIAQAIFKSWFIDFDPVRAKMEVHAPAGMDQEIAVLFPDELVESELGLVPKGWKVGSLSDLSDLNPESWTARKRPDRLAYIDLANAKENVISELVEYVFDEAPSRARRVLRSGDTIVGTVRPGNRSYAFICNPTNNLTGSTGFAVLRPARSENAEFIYLAATRDESIEKLAHLADGGAYPAVRPEVVAQLPCVIPSEIVMKTFHDVVDVLLKKVSNNQLAMQTLSDIRDSLIPKLISGKLRIAEELEAQI